MIISPILPAFMLDLFIGDPKKAPHPVKLIGWTIEKLEPPVRKYIQDELYGGAFLFCFIVAMSFTISFFLWFYADSFHPLAGYVVDVMFIYWSLSVKALGDEAMKVFDLLKTGDIEPARAGVSRLVGRDTENMDESEISRAVVETVSENLVDGVIAPLFFAVIGGGPLAIAYKAVNTSDSMLGYRNEKYEKFGKLSAKADDAANFIPARLSIALIAIASFLLGNNWKGSLKVGFRDRLKHPSPNAGHPESAFAGALGVELGGESAYLGKKSSKPLLGKNLSKTEACHLPEAVKLMRMTAFIACVLSFHFLS